WIGTYEGLAVYREGGVILLKPYAYFYSNSLDFDRVYLSEVKSLKLKVENRGGDILMITGVSIADTSFRFLGNLPLVLNPGDTGFLNFSFNPSSSRFYVDTALIYSNSQPDSVFKLVLMGRGVKPPYLSSSIDSIDFGTVLVGDTVIKFLKLYNLGEIDTIRVVKLEISEPFSVVLSSNVINPGDSLNVILRFKPLSGRVYDGLLKVISTAWNDTLEIKVYGKGVPVMLNANRRVQSGVVKFICRFNAVDSVRLKSFFYSVDGGSSWRLSSSVSSFAGIGVGVDTIYWDSKVDLNNFESANVAVRMDFSIGSFDFSVRIDSVGVDNLAPRFRGVFIGEGDTNRVILRWFRGEDISFVRYRVYRSNVSGVYDFSSYAVEVSDTFAVVGGLDNFKRYYFVVRAVDEFGNFDTNLVEVSVVPGGKSSVIDLVLVGDSLSGDVKFVLRLNSVSGDTVNLKFYYSVDGGSSWVESENVFGVVRDIRNIFSFPHFDTLVWRSRLDTIVESDRCLIKVIPFGLGGEGYGMQSSRFLLDNLAPRFRGVKSYKNLPFGKIILYWDKAVDISQVRYEVFVSDSLVFSGVEVDSAFVSGLRTSTNYNFIVRVSDLFGNESFSSYSVKVNALCDYNGDGKIDAFDLGRYVKSWSELDYSGSDIYPYDGSLPYVIVLGDGKLDVYDVFTFTKIWDYSHTQGLPKVLSFDGFDFAYLTSDGEFVFKPDIFGDFVSYGFEIIHRGVKVDSFNVLRDGISLVFMDSLRDVIYFDYSKFGGIKEDGLELFRIKFGGFGSGDSVVVKFYIYDGNSLSLGKEVLKKVYVLKFDDMPKEFRLYQNYPNPFNPSTFIKFDLPREAKVKLSVYDVMGRLVRVLVDEQMQAGRYRVEFRGDGLASGVYFYRLEAGGFVSVKKMVLVK
ncbi:T9SS type A sorting domain-containing protein, partial [Candidatus Kryptobacter tengchongensis]